MAKIPHRHAVAVLHQVPSRICRRDYNSAHSATCAHRGLYGRIFQSIHKAEIANAWRSFYRRSIRPLRWGSSTFQEKQDDCPEPHRSRIILAWSFSVAVWPEGSGEEPCASHFLIHRWGPDDA